MFETFFSEPLKKIVRSNADTMERHYDLAKEVLENLMKSAQKFTSDSFTSVDSIVKSGFENLRRWCDLTSEKQQ